MKHETDDDSNNGITKRSYMQDFPSPQSNANQFNIFPQYGGSIPSSPPEYDNLYDMSGNGIDYPLHDELLQMCRANGLEAIATDSGIIKNGEISVLKDYSTRDQLPTQMQKTTINSPNTTTTTTSTTTATTKITPISQNTHSNPPAILAHHKNNYPSIPSHSEVNCNNSTSTNTLNSDFPTPSNTTTTSTSRQNSFQSPPPTPLSSAGSMLSQSGEDSADEGPGKKRKRAGSATSSNNTVASFKADKDDKSGNNKGLRHFSLKVCQKVETKRTTSYNEVADELVGEIQANSEQVVTPVEQKNIRRRVYDVLNVLMAMNIISKDKKEIHWIGLPTESKKPYDEYKKEKQLRLERIKKKKENLAELMAQQVSYRNLLARNGKTEYAGTAVKARIYLPFIVVNTKAQTVINCEVAHDRSKYFFNFSNPFEIYDDNEVLKRMGLSACAYNDEPMQNSDSSQFPKTNLNMFPPT